MSLPRSPPCTYCGAETSPHGEEFRYLTDGVWHHRSCHPPDRYRPTVPSEALGRTLGPIAMDWERAGIEARAYGHPHRGSSPELSDGTPPSTGSSEPTSVGPGASPVASQQAYVAPRREHDDGTTQDCESLHRRDTEAARALEDDPGDGGSGRQVHGPDQRDASGASAPAAGRGTSDPARVAVAGVVPAAPSRADVPSGEGGSGVATPAAGPGESSAAYVRFRGRIRAPAFSPTPQQQAGPPTSEATALGGGVGDLPFGPGTANYGPGNCGRCGRDLSGDRATWLTQASCWVHDRCLTPSPDPAGSVTSLGAGSGDSEWDRALELAGLEGLAGRMLTLAEAVDDPGTVVSGRTMAELIRMAVGGGA